MDVLDEEQWFGSGQFEVVVATLTPHPFLTYAKVSQLSSTSCFPTLNLTLTFKSLKNAGFPPQRVIFGNPSIEPISSTNSKLWLTNPLKILEDYFPSPPGYVSSIGYGPCESPSHHLCGHQCHNPL